MANPPTYCSICHAHGCVHRPIGMRFFLIFALVLCIRIGYVWFGPPEVQNAMQCGAFGPGCVSTARGASPQAGKAGVRAPSHAPALAARARACMARLEVLLSADFGGALDRCAAQYVHLALAAGTYDPKSIGTYIGPKEWQSRVQEAMRGAARVPTAVAYLMERRLSRLQTRLAALMGAATPLTDAGGVRGAAGVCTCVGASQHVIFTCMPVPPGSGPASSSSSAPGVNREQRRAAGMHNVRRV